MTANGPQQQQTHVGLDELRALLSDPGHKAEHVHLLLGVHHVDHGVDDDEGAGPAHAGAAGREAGRSRESTEPHLFSLYTVCTGI